MGVVEAFVKALAEQQGDQLDFDAFVRKEELTEGDGVVGLPFRSNPAIRFTGDAVHVRSTHADKVNGPLEKSLRLIRESAVRALVQCRENFTSNLLWCQCRGHKLDPSTWNGCLSFLRCS